MVPAELDDYLAPENKARIRIDEMLERAGWVVQDYKNVNFYAGPGVAVRELVTNAGPADYVLFLNQQAVGVIEAKKQGTSLLGVEWPIREERERFKRFSYDELVARDKASLDIFWLRDQSLEDTDNLPPPGVIAAEIVVDLEAALEEFRALAESLEGIGIDIEDAE